MSKRGSVWFCMIVIIVVMFYGLTPMVAEQDSVYRTYAPLIEVDALIHREYVAPIRRMGLVDGAIRGMLFELDRYSGYVSADEMPSFERHKSGAYVGIGVVIGVVNGAITVIAPFEDGPAMRAGVEAGDVILTVAGHSTKDLSVFDVEGILVGAPDTSVTARFRRPSGERFDVDVMRSRVHRRPIKGYIHDSETGWDYWVSREPRIAYIRVTEFIEGMIDDFDEAVGTVREQGAKGLIIDLRFNPGGLLAQAVALLNRFIDSGTLVSTVTRWEAVQTYAATAEGTMEPIPVAVLVNGWSASSSEIVSGSLQDHGRAIIVGERTFGKGSVQDFIELQGGRAGVKLTVAYYQLPSGRIIHKTPSNADTKRWGVWPDVEVPITVAERAAIHRARADVGSVGDHVDRQLRAAIDALVPLIESREGGDGLSGE